MFRRAFLLATSCVLVAATHAVAQDETRTVRVRFDPGTTGTVITDRIQGYESVIYELGARDGQFLKVSLRPDNQSTDFNIYVPGRGPGDEALFTSAIGGREYYGQLYLDGDHKVAVFLNRNAARQGQVANYDIAFEITAGEAPGAGAGVSKAESDCLVAVAEQVGVSRSALSVISSEMGENYTVVKVRVPEAQAPWQCDWGYTDQGPGVVSVMYTGSEGAL